MKNSSFPNYFAKFLVIFLLAVMPIMASACTSSDIPGEESGAELTQDETYDRIRNGVRLVLTHDADSNSFKGFIENATNEELQRVRVEVHLSNGVELGPTNPVDLAPGESKAVRLLAKNSVFETWTAHLEVSGETRE